MRQDQIAIQLYSVRQAMAADPHGTLRKVAAMGYRAVEPLLYVGDEARAIRATLDELGLVARSAHVPLAEAEARFDVVADGLLAMGCDYIVAPWIVEADRGVAQAGQLASRLNTIGAQARDRGLRLAYHNHDFEFAREEGDTMWELLAAQTDPDLVRFELDIYWASVAGFDPAELLERYAGRIPLVHVKERAAGEPPRFGIIGEGVFDWGRILGAAERAGAEWYIVEHDSPADPLPDMERGLRGLERVAGLV
jgi:sugar phosphate isomerase/epimerase